MNNKEKETIREMLDYAYELEALLHLMSTREDLPEDIPMLIDTKLEALARLRKQIGAEQEKVLIQEPVYAETNEDNLSDVAYGCGEAEAIGEKRVKTEKGKLVFSLNDRFLYARTLFGGDLEKFNSELTLIAEMDTFDEAEEHFYNECRLDPEQSEVMGFMAVVQRYFT